MNSMQRVVTTLGFQEPDYVPVFLTLTMHGAKELGLSIEEYFSKAEYVIEGQMRLWKKYGHDCLYPFFYAAVELEAFGGDVLYVEDGPPNAGRPIITSAKDIENLVLPDVANTPCLRKVLDTIAGLKERVGDTVPIIGVAISPFSLPVMQMGFEAYLDLMHERQEEFWRLMRFNQAFCTQWANAQVKAGATAICYFDPISSSTLIPRERYLETGFVIARQTLATIPSAVAVHMASGRCLPIADLLPQTGAAVVGVSNDEDLAQLKAAFVGKLVILGNLNGVVMRRWTAKEVEDIVKTSISKAASGGGFILGDNHGEIPFQVPDEVLFALMDAARTWGHYPIG